MAASASTRTWSRRRLQPARLSRTCPASFDADRRRDDGDCTACLCIRLRNGAAKVNLGRRGQLNTAPLLFEGMPMANNLTKVFKEIDRNPNLTEHEKLKQKAAAMRDWRSLNDEPVMTRG